MAGEDEARAFLDARDFLSVNITTRPDQLAVPLAATHQAASAKFARGANLLCRHGERCSRTTPTGRAAWPISSARASTSLAAPRSCAAPARRLRRAPAPLPVRTVVLSSGATGPRTGRAGCLRSGIRKAVVGCGGCRPPGSIIAASARLLTAQRSVRKLCHVHAGHPQRRPRGERHAARHERGGSHRRSTSRFSARTACLRCGVRPRRDGLRRRGALRVARCRTAQACRGGPSDVRTVCDIAGVDADLGFRPVRRHGGSRRLSGSGGLTAAERWFRRSDRPGTLVLWLSHPDLRRSRTRVPKYASPAIPTISGTRTASLDLLAPTRTTVFALLETGALEEAPVRG